MEREGGERVEAAARRRGWGGRRADIEERVVYLGGEALSAEEEEDDDEKIREQVERGVAREVRGGRGRGEQARRWRRDIPIIDSRLTSIRRVLGDGSWR